MVLNKRGWEGVWRGLTTVILLFNQAHLRRDCVRALSNIQHSLVIINHFTKIFHLEFNTKDIVNPVANVLIFNEFP